MSSTSVLGAAASDSMRCACCVVALARWSCGLVSTQYLISTNVYLCWTVSSVLLTEYRVISGRESGWLICALSSELTVLGQQH